MARILVIDDAVELRGLLHTVLTRKGHEVFLAADGQRGIDLFLEVRPMITVLDLHMDSLDGLEVLQHIRSADADAVVIMLTGWFSEESKAKARALGVAHFLEKGGSLAEFSDVVKHLVAGRSQLPTLTRPAGMKR